MMEIVGRFTEIHDGDFSAVERVDVMHDCPVEKLKALGVRGILRQLARDRGPDSRRGGASRQPQEEPVATLRSRSAPPKCDAVGRAARLAATS